MTNFSSAKFSPDRVHRYGLWRTWDKSKEIAIFIGLNPSTADETKNDPTVSRCINYAMRWGFGGMIMSNIFACRATDPKVMKATEDPVGPENDQWLLKLSKEARAASKSANRNAMRAICLSIIAIIISAVLTLAQLNAPTTINQSDLQALMNSNTAQREVKLDNLQMAQILTAIGYDKHRPMVKKQRTTDQGKEISHHELINKYFEEE